MDYLFIFYPCYQGMDRKLVAVQHFGSLRREEVEGWNRELVGSGLVMEVSQKK